MTLTSDLLIGIDFVLFYAPSLFTQAGLDAKTSSIVASGVTGILLFLVAAFGTFYVDKVGRRSLIIWGGACVACSYLCIGSMCEYTYLCIDPVILLTSHSFEDASGAAYTPAGKWAIIVFIEMFAVTYAGSWSLCVRLYSAEIQPSRTRAAASSFGQGANQLINTVVALTSPALLAKSAFGQSYQLLLGRSQRFTEICI